MKLSFTPIAAVALALASTAAQAQLAPPTQATTTPPTNSTLWVGVWNTATNATELVNLSYNYAALTAAGALTPNSSADPNAANYVSAANPTGAAGNVLQLNFGTIANFATNFTGANALTATNSAWTVIATNGTSSALFTYLNNTTPFGVSASGLTTQTGHMNAEIADWLSTAPSSGAPFDSAGTTNYAANNAAALAQGTFGTPTFNFSNALGSAMFFFNAVPGARGANPTVTQFMNSSGAGFWFLSTTGQLTWNVPMAAAAVPLPAAAWLLVSGLLGLGAIGRRRVAVAA